MPSKNTAVAVKKGNDVMSPEDQEKLARMREAFPVEERVSFMSFPRLSMVSQDKTEEVINPKTKKKELNIIAEAGTFMTEIQDAEETAVEEEVVKNGKKKIETVMKKLWQKTEVGTEIEGTIIFYRKQLKFFDEVSGVFISSAVYDKDTDVIPLFGAGREEIARGTPKELQEPYMKVQKGMNGKPDKNVSDLRDNRILYVFVPSLDKVFQMTIAGTSMYAYMEYARQVKNPSEFVTKFSSTTEEKGKIRWNKMSFETVRSVTSEEIDLIDATQQHIRDNIAKAKEFFAQKDAEKTQSDKALNDF